MSEVKGNRNPFKAIAKFFGDCKSEIKKIVWPNSKSVFRNTGVVLAAIVIVGLFVFGLDRGLYFLLSFVMDTTE